MPTSFPKTSGRTRGYRPADVDRFLAEARHAFESGGAMTAADIRQTAFTMERNGYVPQAVDSALERLEDAIAARDRDRAVAVEGEKAWFATTRGLAREIIARLGRPANRRFERAGVFTIGYSCREVDAFADRARSYFEGSSDLRAEEVRAIAFRPKRHGYREAQVDLVLDGIVEVMLAVR